MLYFISLSAKYILSTRDLRGLVQCKSGTIRRFFNFFSILIVGIERPLPSSLNRRCSYKGSAKKLMSSRTLEDKKGVKVLQCSTNAISKIRRLKHIPTLWEGNRVGCPKFKCYIVGNNMKQCQLCRNSVCPQFECRVNWVGQFWCFPKTRCQKATRNPSATGPGTTPWPNMKCAIPSPMESVAFLHQNFRIEGRPVPLTNSALSSVLAIEFSNCAKCVWERD